MWRLTPLTSFLTVPRLAGSLLPSHLQGRLELGISLCVAMPGQGGPLPASRDPTPGAKAPEGGELLFPSWVPVPGTQQAQYRLGGWRIKMPVRA